MLLKQDLQSHQVHIMLSTTLASSKGIALTAGGPQASYLTSLSHNFLTKKCCCGKGMVFAYTWLHSRCQLCWMRMTEQSPPALETWACSLRFRDHNELVPMPLPVPVTLCLGLTVSLLSALQAYFLICRLLTGGWLPKDNLCISGGYISCYH